MHQSEERGWEGRVQAKWAGLGGTEGRVGQGVVGWGRAGWVGAGCSGVGQG